jgi:ABC-2 type transport system permease protein
MTTGLVAASVHRPSAGHAVGLLVLRQLRRGTLIVTGVCAGMSALVATQYRSTFEDEMSQQAVTALAENPAIRVLFGPAVALDDPGGFTVWRTGTPVLILAGVWLLLAAIRITRGEEDAGRWDLLLSGRARSIDVLLRCVATVAGSAVAISASIGVAMVAAGTDVEGAAVYSLGVLGVTATFGAVGLAAGQVMPSRPAAVGLAVGVLGAALLLRMLSDGIAALAFAAWLTPFGLIGQSAPYSQNRLLPLVVLAVFATIATAIALAAARGRDIGGGWVPVRSHRPAHSRLLGSPALFAVRCALRPTLGWAAGIGAYFLIIGAMIASILEFFEGSPRFGELAAGAGFGNLGTASGFAAALFGLLAIPTGLYAVTRLASAVGDERANRTTMLLATPLSRQRLLAAVAMVAAVGVLTLHVVAALGMWAGAALTGAPLGLGDALAGAMNTAPIAWLALGAAALAFGWVPPAVTAVGALPVVGGFLLNVIADSIGAPQWVSASSPFVHVAAAPAVPPNWPATAVILAVGVILLGAGVIGYARRDVAT